MSEHQWTILIIGAATIMGACIGRVLERIEVAAEKRKEYEARKAVAQTVRVLTLRRPDDTLPPAA